MKQKGKFNYYTSEELRAHVLQMPYKGDDISMIIILPPFEDDALYTTVQKMTPETIQGVMAEVRSGFYEVDDLTVEIPKFKIEQSLELSDTLSKLGASFLGWVDLTLEFLIKTELFPKLTILYSKVFNLITDILCNPIFVKIVWKGSLAPTLNIVRSFA